jgi:hypothetical protein
MEALIYFVMAHGTMVITTLLGAIILCVFALLMISFHSPKEAVALELGSVERLEGVLRNMLSDQNWSRFGKPTSGEKNSDLLGSGDQVSLLVEQVNGLETELKEKQKMIDDMMNLSPDEPLAAPLKMKIKELEDKLAEYSVIEEDIADLTRFRQENESLRSRITEVTGMEAQDAMAMPWEEFEKIVKEKKALGIGAPSSIAIETAKPG